MGKSVLFGNYELVGRIAEGGMAEVWRARSRGAAGFEKTVVIKRVLPSLMANPSFAELLVREAKIAALLNHPNIIQIFDLGEEQGAYFIAMEYVHGRDLASAMAWRPDPKKRGATTDGLSLALKLRIAMEVAKALDYAHRRKGDDGRPLLIVHRDVSPHNVLLGYEGEIKVADFGIARADDEGLGRGEDPKVLRGKYAYMSPEQARGEPLDRRSDLFSLGIVLWEMLAKKRLFRGKSSTETLERVRRAEIPALDAQALGIPQELSRIVARALARERDERYPSASALHADLAQLVADQRLLADEGDLTEAMHAMFPASAAVQPNKLRVDLMMRAYDDATSLSQGDFRDPAIGRPSEEGTAVLPTSRKIHSETRRVVVLVAPDEPPRGEAGADRVWFDEVVLELGGVPLPPSFGVREAVFGHAVGAENAARHAARAALEIKRRYVLDAMPPDRTPPPMAIIGAEARVFEGGAVDPEPDARDSARALMEGAPRGEIRCELALRGELSRTFRLAESEEPHGVVEGFRDRHERAAVALRQRAPLVGRRTEMERLSRALVEVSEGRGRRAILLVGDAGAGKSRLLAELRTAAASQDVQFVTGRGDEADLDRPYGTLADVFRDLAGVEDGDPPEQLHRKIGRLRVLGLEMHEVRLVGELLGLAYPLAPLDRPTRPRGLDLMVTLRKSLRALAREKPVVLALEDVHWMDEPTRHLLPLLVRGLAGARVLVLLTMRPGTPIATIAADVLSLDPLDASASARLFGACAHARIVEEELRAAIVRATSGNAGAIEVLAEDARARDEIVVENDEARSVRRGFSLPREMIDRTSALMSHLSAAERELLRAVASFERDIEVSILGEVLGTGPEGYTGVLRRLLGRRHLEPVGKTWPLFRGAGQWGGGRDDLALPRRVRIAGGDLVRRAILATLSEAELRRLHARVLSVLERTTTDDYDARSEDLAFHAARSIDRRRAPDYLVSAAEIARKRGDLRLAAERLADAARFLHEDDRDEERATAIAIEAAETALDAGDPELAERVLAAEIAEARSDAASKVRLAIARARALMRRGRWVAAGEALEVAVQLLPAVKDDELRGRALLERGVALLEGGDPEEAADVLAQAIDALSSGAPPLHARALFVRASALARAGRVDSASRVAATALASAARIGDAATRSGALAALAEVEDAAGELASAGDRWKEAWEVARDGQLDEPAARAALCAAIAYIEAGKEDRAVALAEEGVRLGRTHKLDTIATLGAAVQGVLAVSTHPDASYLPALLRACERLEASRQHADAAMALAMLARARLALGEPLAAAGALWHGAALAREGGRPVLAARLESRARELDPTLHRATDD